MRRSFSQRFTIDTVLVWDFIKSGQVLNFCLHLLLSIPFFVSGSFNKCNCARVEEEWIVSYLPMP